MESIMDIMGVAWKGDSVERLSSQIHESQVATRKGLESAVPLSMAGLASLFSSEQKASELLGTLKGGNFPRVEASEIGRLVTDPVATSELAQSSSGFLSRIFGGKFDGMLDSLAGTTGVSRTSATTLLGIAAPLVLGAIHKESQERSLDARGLSRLLSEEGQKAKGLLPTGLSNLFGRTAPAEIVPSHARRVTYAEKAFETHSYSTPEMAPPQAMAPPPLPTEVRRVQEARAPEIAPGPVRRSSGLWWLLLPLALLGLFGLMRMGKREPERITGAPVAAPRVTAPKVTAPRATAPAGAPPIERPQVEVQEPQAVTPPPTPVAPAVPAPTTLAPTTMEAAPAVTAEPVTTRVEPTVSVVHFATSSDDPLNRGVMRKVVATLTEHPDARVRLRGYADPRGDQAMNQALSEARANSVRAYLVSHGVSADRIDMVGRGTEDQLDSNADSRRVELIVER